ncbi:hypothetical protein [Virgibacillus indicus]|uniref:hypothetical protein n=1 Tax=Virgibacillus indicus TaxID=2024554 RepID=UPI0013FD16EC|nr:hypothetical protein [Virgibacillus indicus]
MMRFSEKQWNSATKKDIYGVNFHNFLEMEGDSNHMEIAEELGISVGEVKMLKKKINRA